MTAIPDRMKHLDVYRGYPVPFGVQRDADGVPHFAVNNEAARVRSIRDDLCSICGTKLFRGRWFVGGPGSAFDPLGVYIDMPMHDECAHYALHSCPYLAAPRYVREIGLQKWQAAKKKNAILTIDPTIIPERPIVFVAVMAVGQRMTGGNGLQSYVEPSRPYRKVEFWRHGQQISADEGWDLSSKATGFSVLALMRLVRSKKEVAS